MKSFNVICGVPRSGSTLLCNVLNQHKDIHCSSTSPLSALVSSAVHSVSSSEETKSMLIHDQELTETQILRSIQGAISGWYEHCTEHVFDKGRGWSINMGALRYVVPGAIAVVTVRDPRDIIASVQKAHSKMPLIDTSINLLEKTAFIRAEQLMSPEGLVGSAILGVEDVLRRGGGGDRTIFAKYEHFVNAPEVILAGVISRLGLEEFDFDLDNVERACTDIDGVYLNKFPHDGSGKINSDGVGAWPNSLDAELAEQVRNRYPYYCKAFGY